MAEETDLDLVRQHWAALHDQNFSYQAIVQFHSRHKYLLMAHSPKDYQELGRHVAHMKDIRLDTFAQNYFCRLEKALSQPATPGRHANVLQHLAGYLRPKLDHQERQELERLIEDYRQGVHPLATPMQRLREHFALHPDGYIASQVYLYPDIQPGETTA